MIEPASLIKDRVIQPGASEEERRFELTLRPKFLQEFIGQTSLKDNLRVFLEAAKKRGEPLEHVLFYGNPGLGKTTLAHVVANEIGGQIRVTSGPSLERVGDLAAILSNLGRGDILFIDEIHRLNKTIEEVLYPAMEDYALDLVVGKGPTARTLRLDLEPFTIIGATTRLSLLSAPLRDRFGAVYHLNLYEPNEMHEIVTRNATRLGIELEASAGEEISRRARRTPRVANRLLRRVRDFAQVHGDGRVHLSLAQQALKLLEVDEAGLDRVDRLILQTIMEKYHGGPVGLNTLAAATQEELETIEEVIEPFLLQLGFLERTPRGRLVTDLAYRHLNQPRSPHLV